ncbi:MAG: RibD family protein [Coprobacter sp.]|nr:RibD family protein [Coprobacter sp.]
MKPYIICHMMASVDGRIDCDMTEQIESGDEYYEALAQLQCPSMLMGRVTMQMHYALPEPFVAADATAVGHECFYVAERASAYCVATDTLGRLQWGDNNYDGQHLLVITSEDCPAEYHATLRERGISFIATGKGGIDLLRAMAILREHFGVERLAVTGGGHINGAFLDAGLLDEVSLMIAPGIDGRAGMAAVFDGIADMNHTPVKLQLMSVERIGEETVWIRYRV